MAENRTYWTIREGVVGTAHKNRHGQEVDFHPMTRSVLVYGRPSNALGDRTDDDVVREVVGSVRVALVPAKGVLCEPLLLEPTFIEHRFSEENGRGMLRFIRATATYEGISFEAIEVGSYKEIGAYIFTPFVFSSLAGRQGHRAVVAEALRLLQEVNAVAGALTPRQAITFGRPVYTHLRQGIKRVWENEARRVQRNLLAHFGLMDDVRVLPSWAQDCATLRARILEERG